METTSSEDQLQQPLLPSESPSPTNPDEGMCSQPPLENNGYLEPAPHEELPSSDELQQDHAVTPWYKSPLQLIAMLSNYSTSYNVVNISMVIPILEHTVKGTNPEDVAASASSLLAGMIVGQLVGGYLGDTHLGRLGALQLVMVLQIVASIGAALFLWPEQSMMSRDAFYAGLAFFRFLLGVGAGGVYPLAAVLSAEQGGQDKRQQQPREAEEEEEEEEEQSLEQVRRVVLTFSTQGLGFISVPAISVLLLSFTSNLNVVWRLILAFGSVPGLILMAAQMWIHRKNAHSAVPLHEEESPAEAPQAVEHDDVDLDNDGILRNMHVMEQQLRVHENRGRWETLRQEPNLIPKLLGTAGTWFLFDVLFYGNSLFQPVVIDAAFGNALKGGDPISEIRNTAIKSLFVYGIALPGYAVAGLVMGRRILWVRQTPKFVMLQGFAAMGTLYLALGTNWNALKHTPVLLVVLYGMTFFFANYGPNTTTFILPSMVFSPECRTTLNGVSAAAGKLGALTGATLFEPLVEDIGDANVMLMCAGVAFVAFLMTWKFVRTYSNSNSTGVYSTSNPNEVTA